MTEQATNYEHEAQQIESDRAMYFLQSGVPLSLLADLALPVNSNEILTHEGGQAEWLVHGAA